MFHWASLKLTQNGPTSFVLIAIPLLTGLLGGYLLASPLRRTELCTFPLDFKNAPFDHGFPQNTPQPSIDTSYQSSQGSLLVSDDLGFEELRSMVTSTRGYYARDYSLHLGWNNMRFIIETALHHGSLLNRTVIIPSFIYARSCEFENTVCAAYAPMVNRGDALNWDEWRKLPEDQQMGWRVPMSVMLNLTHLRRFQPVITVAEYLRLHNLSPDLEVRNGYWDTQKYHQSPSVYDTHPPSLRIIENDWYDPKGLNRVDVLPEEMKLRGHWDPLLGDPGKDQTGGWPNLIKTDAYTLLERIALLGTQYALDFDIARQLLQIAGIREIDSDDDFTRFLSYHGWEVLYTFDGALGVEYVKNVINPVKQVVARDSIRGFVDDYYHHTEDVLLLKGEIHYTRKPASLQFTSTLARDAFARLVLFEIRHTDSVMELSATMARRMHELVGGRMWMGAHMRRGDFLRYNFTMQPDLGDHLQRIKGVLDKARDILRSITPESLVTYAVPDVEVNPEFIRHHPPNRGDPIYIATDERDPGNLAYLREHGVIRAPDLITIEDRRRFGWPLLITDVLGIVEQEFLARGSFFYANALSSVDGGILNIRAANGADPRTSQISD